MSLKPYKIAFLDGSGRAITESEFQRFRRREDFELIGTNMLRQIQAKASYFGEKLLKAMAAGGSDDFRFEMAEVPGLKAIGCTSSMPLAREANRWVAEQG